MIAWRKAGCTQGLKGGVGGEDGSGACKRAEGRAAVEAAFSVRPRAKMYGRGRAMQPSVPGYVRPRTSGRKHAFGPAGVRMLAACRRG